MKDTLDTKKTWLTSKQAAAHLNISIGQLLNLVSKGKIPYYKLGRSNRYLESELDILLLSTRNSSLGPNQT